MKRILKITAYFVLISLAIFVQSSCSSGKATIYSERSIKPSDVPIKKVAIVPNRLPLNLTNAEYWKKYNFELIKNRFSDKGYQVLDYNTSNRLFEESGLPMSDTKISRDKYAELAEELGVDILVFPYYGQLFEMSNYAIIMISKYKSIGSLQFYSTKHNDFISRVDFEGVKKVPSSPIIPVVGTIVPMIVWGPKGSYRKAYKKALNLSVDRFTQKYNSRGSSSKASTKRAQKTNTTKSTNTSSDYSKYSVEELKVMKKDALRASDYSKAAAIQKVIDAGGAKSTNSTNSNNVSNSNTGSGEYDKYSLKELKAMKSEALKVEDYSKAAAIKKAIDAKEAKLKNSKYGKYTIDELKAMKAKAVKDGEYKKAGEIKKEIESR